MELVTADPIRVTPGQFNTPASPSSVSMVSQTQAEVEDVDSDDEEDDPVAVRYSETEFDSITDDVNRIFDPDDDLIREELDCLY